MSPADAQSHGIQNFSAALSPYRFQQWESELKVSRKILNLLCANGVSIMLILKHGLHTFYQKPIALKHLMKCHEQVKAI
jgi:hypothetical protein